MQSTPTDDDDAVRERMALRAEWNNVAGRIVRRDLTAQDGWLSSPRVDELAVVARELLALVPVMRARRYHLPDLDSLTRAATRSTVPQPT